MVGDRALGAMVMISGALACLNAEYISAFDAVSKVELVKAGVMDEAVFSSSGSSSGETALAWRGLGGMYGILKTLCSVSVLQISSTYA